MKNPLGNSWRTGIFKIAPGKEMHGTLLLDGPNTALHVWGRDGEGIDLQSYLSTSDGIVTGVLDDQRKVSLIRCHITGPGTNYRGGHLSLSYKIFPSYIICGNRYFSDTDEDISKISFVLDDVTALFSDTDVFGCMSSPREKLQRIMHAKDPLNKVVIGNNPWITYYTGRAEIFSVDTTVGKVVARHSPTLHLGGPKGMNIANKIFFDIEFGKACTIYRAFSQMWKVIHFLELVMGRTQDIVEILINAGVIHELESTYVYTSMFPTPQHSEGPFGITASMDPLMSAVQDSDKLTSVLSKWLEREDAWYAARSRFADGWKKNWNYDVDRLIRAANIFDLLPKDEFSINETLPDSIGVAVEETKERFRGLPEHPARTSILDALGRVGALTLKRKIHSRSQILIDRIGGMVPHIDKVIDEAVDCRNLYVHGTSPKSGLSYEEYEIEQIFLTNTLEFIFAASDLVDAEWDIENWCDSLHLGHPFARYLVEYDSAFDQLEVVFNKHKRKT